MSACRPSVLGHANLCMMACLMVQFDAVVLLLAFCGTWSADQRTTPFNSSMRMQAHIAIMNRLAHNAKGSAWS